MNNEEKILAMLEQMQSDITGLKQGQSTLRCDMDKRFDKVDKKLEALESSINYAAKDAKAYIQRHEKEFHHA